MRSLLFMTKPFLRSSNIISAACINNYQYKKRLFSIMASQQMSQSPLETKPHTSHVCSIIPPTLLLDILASSDNSDATRAAVQNTYNHCCKLHDQRKIRQTTLEGQVHGLAAGAAAGGVSGGRSIIPSYVFQDIAESEVSSPEQRQHAQANLIKGQKIHAARAEANRGSGASITEGIQRQIYDSRKTSRLRSKLLYKEGGDVKILSTDQSAKEVYDFFGNTYEFYKEVFNRDSIDNENLALIASLHFDDKPGPPGMDNAFWDGDEMAFGDGDGDIFGSFTKNIDVIGHELTHGVVQHTANLEYEFQSGALNESMADVFGSMIKQYFHPNGKQKARDADWLIGEGIFLPRIANAKALRSMKAPGTAYNNPRIGKDRQPADMDGFQELPNTREGDSGGVHINSGIPNHAFYLTAVALGGFSWEKAGKIWYAALEDETLRGIDTENAFKPFADLTTKYALSLFDEETEAVVKKAWTDVKVYSAVANEPIHDEI